MKKFIIGFVLAAVCVGGVSVMAETNDKSGIIEGTSGASKNGNGKSNEVKPPIEVKPVNGGNIVSADDKTNSNVNNGVNNKRTEIENYIKNTYGEDWVNFLRTKNGDDWDDILENELEKQFGHKHEELIEDIIEAKEHEYCIINNIACDDDHDDCDDIINGQCQDDDCDDIVNGQVDKDDHNDDDHDDNHDDNDNDDDCDDDNDDYNEIDD